MRAVLALLISCLPILASADTLCFERNASNAKVELSEATEMTLTTYSDKGEKRSSVKVERLGQDLTTENEIDVTLSNRGFVPKTTVNLNLTRIEKVAKYLPDHVVINGDSFGLKSDASASERYSSSCFALHLAPTKFVDNEELN